MAIDSVVWVGLFVAAVTAIGAATGHLETTASGLDTDLEGRPATAALLLWLGLAIGYHTLLEWQFGKTVGKHLVGIRVVDDAGTPPSLLGSLVRNVFRLVDWLPGCYFVGVVSLAMSSRNRRLGDLAGKTAVVRL